MFVKLHFLYSHLELFKENFGDFSEEHGKRFYQDIEPIEKLYKGCWDSAMMEKIGVVTKEKLAQQCIFE